MKKLYRELLDLAQELLQRGEQLLVSLTFRVEDWQEEFVSASAMPPAMRLQRGCGKWLMKRSLERYLPRDILYRSKMGFVTPISDWFRGALADEAAGLATSSLLRETGWFALPEIARLADDHRAGRAEHGRTLWQFLMLERSLTRLFG